MPMLLPPVRAMKIRAMACSRATIRIASWGLSLTRLATLLGAAGPRRRLGPGEQFARASLERVLYSFGRGGVATARVALERGERIGSSVEERDARAELLRKFHGLSDDERGQVRAVDRNKQMPVLAAATPWAEDGRARDERGRKSRGDSTAGILGGAAPRAP